MALYSYKKITYNRRKSLRFRVRFFSFSFILLGLIILSWILYPIISFELIYAPRFGSSITSPLADNMFTTTLKEEVSQVLGISDIDYTRASIWFPKAVNVKQEHTDSLYKISIPKLRIENALVVVGGDDLSKSLIHFTGPLPGNYGNPVIFGHSTLPFLYNPKDYKTIFTKLPDLHTNDEIYVTTNSITYRYIVFDMKIVSAEDLSVLDQDYQNSNITLITCVPPGTYFKRLIVRGKLVSF